MYGFQNQKERVLLEEEQNNKPAAAKQAKAAVAPVTGSRRWVRKPPARSASGGWR